MISTNQLMAGTGLDEIYAQTNSSGAISYLRDGLNNTVVLTNGSAATTANYSYSPYEDSARTGSATTALPGRDNCVYKGGAAYGGVGAALSGCSCQHWHLSSLAWAQTNRLRLWRNEYSIASQESCRPSTVTCGARKSSP
jgi:hypothetical protein